MADLQVAHTIQTQIGNQALMMMGARNMLGSEDSLSFKVGRNAKGVTHVTVKLDPSDTYTVTFLRCNARAREMRKILSEVEWVYFDQLRDVLRSGTGLEVAL